MINTYSFSYDGESSLNYGLNIKKRPIIPIAEEEVTSYDIPSTNGSKYKHMGVYSDLEILLSCWFTCEKDKVKSTMREVRKWLVPNKYLSLDDDSEFSYLVKNIIISEVGEANGLVASFVITFVASAYKLHTSAFSTITVEDVLLNPFERSKPIYKLLGEGYATFSVNETEINVNISTSVTIDTEKRIIYNNEGDNINSSVDYFDFEDFYLLNGSNSLSISDGFTIEVVPMWGEIQ